VSHFSALEIREQRVEGIRVLLNTLFAWSPGQVALAPGL